MDLLQPLLLLVRSGFWPRCYCIPFSCREFYWLCCTLLRYCTFIFVTSAFSQLNPYDNTFSYYAFFQQATAHE